MDPLEAISPIDGRYRKTTDSLAAFFSEGALIRYRAIVEGEYWIALSELGGLGIRPFTDEEKKSIREACKLSPEDAAIVRKIETEGYKEIKATDHDVKAVEYLLKDKLAGTTLADSLEWIHFGLTSEDINNLAYALMLRDSLEQVITPAIADIAKALNDLAARHASLPMLARTHGQPASPTTFGKEFKVFAARIAHHLEGLAAINIKAKLNGATGNWNAHIAAYPKVDWMEFSKNFIERFNEGHEKKLRPNPITTQIEWHDSYVAVFDMLRRINTILIGFDQDMWRYISDGWLVQATKEGEVGSSTMPHKVNPLKFENSEGNLGMANALFEFFGRKLPISRLQRDLSDSTVERSFGTAFAHSLLGYTYLIKGLSRIGVNEEKVREDLRAHPEVIAEAIQTILRREGVAMPYEELKKLTRGKQVTMEDFATFIDGLAVSDAVKQELKAITPENYVGLSEKLANS